MMIKNIIITLLISILFSSCFKKDEAVPAHDPGELTTVVIPMTRFYTYQVYFNLNKGEIVSSNNRSAFDLNFSCGDSATIIKLNTANFAMAAETSYTILDEVSDTTGLLWKFDKSDGNPDSITFSNWINLENNDTTYSNKVWVINRGLDDEGNQLGLKKIMFKGLVDGIYYFVHSNMDNTEIIDAIVEKDAAYTYSQYSLSTNKMIQYEPLKTDWDLLFTQYSTLLFTSEGLSHPYLVTGVLQSPNSIIALDTNMMFDKINISDTSSFEFSKSQDKVGYEWKELVGDVETGNFYYETKINNSYIIKDNKSYYYKLRFINFYNPDSGEKGYPTFEFQRL